jgi:xylulokinase
MPLYLGLDSSTQSLTAVVIQTDDNQRRVVLETSLNFDEILPHYGTRNGVLPDPDPAVGVAPPLMWADALEVMMARLADAIDVRQIAAISGSAQQHGSVYLNASATATFGALDASRPLVDQLRGVFSRATAPIWMDSTTTDECGEITAALGTAGSVRLARATGSRAFERFTGPQIRRFFKRDPAAYEATDRIHLVSSFLASLLAGQHAPLEPGDASGMNLMDLAAKQWWPEAIAATAPDLASKLPPIVDPWTRVGTLAPYWQRRYGFSATPVIAWTGDNPSSLIGVGLVREGQIAISLGTSDTVFGPMSAPRVNDSGTGHVFGAPTGAYMALTCFQNGSLAREQVRADRRLSWSEFSQALASTPPGNGGCIMVPWFAPEITPPVKVPAVHRYGADAGGASDVRAVIEAQQLSMALHTRWMVDRVDVIHATGGAAVNREILQVMADVFGASVFQLAVGNSAALGAALRAAHADMRQRDPSTSWEEVLAGFAEPVSSSRVDPDPKRHQMYRDMIALYALCERHALGGIPLPAEAIEHWVRELETDHPSVKGRV